MAVRISLTEQVSSSFSRWTKLLVVGIVGGYVIRLLAEDILTDRYIFLAWAMGGFVLFQALAVARYLQVKDRNRELVDELDSVKEDYDRLYYRHMEVVGKLEQRTERIIERDIQGHQDSGPTWEISTGNRADAPYSGISEEERRRIEEADRLKNRGGGGAERPFVGYESYRAENQQNSFSPTLPRNEKIGRMEAYRRQRDRERGGGRTSRRY